MNTKYTTIKEQSGANHVKLVCGQPYEDYRMALIIKRTYKIVADGTCVLADEQEPVEEDSRTYDELQPPLVSPPCCDNDCFAFKEDTDIIVQGMAHTYGKPLRETTVGLRFRDVSREIRVYGDRVCGWGLDGRIVFSDPEPFEEMPVRYDRAYGGYDKTALDRYGDFIAEVMGPVRPEWKLDTTSPFHYPRNSAGKGYLVDADKKSVEGVNVPNLEFPFDPVLPERMAVGDTRQWVHAVLPACFDWSDQSWFPRIGYLGMIAPYEISGDTVMEIRQGWIAPDIFNCGSLFDLKYRIEFLQGASAGLACKGIMPGERFRISNMFAEYPERVIELPGEIPGAVVTPKWKDTKAMEPHLNTVVIRPEDETVILTWSCRTTVHRPYSPDELEKTPYRLSWNKP